MVSRPGLGISLFSYENSGRYALTLFSARKTDEEFRRSLSLASQTGPKLLALSSRSSNSLNPHLPPTTWHSAQKATMSSVRPHILRLFVSIVRSVFSFPSYISQGLIEFARSAYHHVGLVFVGLGKIKPDSQPLRLFFASQPSPGEFVAIEMKGLIVSSPPNGQDLQSGTLDALETTNTNQPIVSQDYLLPNCIDTDDIIRQQKKAQIVYTTEKMRNSKD